MSRYRPQYRDNTPPDIRVCPNIAFSDIVLPRHDIVSFFPISDPILVISAPISVQYRDIPVPCQTRYYQYRARYRFFSRYRLRYRVNVGIYPFLAKPDIGFFTNIGPDMVPILRDIRILGQKNLDVVPDVYAISQYTYIVYFRFRAFFLISGTIYHQLRLRPPPVAQALRPLSRRSDRSSLLFLSSAELKG